MTKIGIENLKKAIGSIIGLGVAVDQATDESSASGQKITLMEALTIAFKSVPDAITAWHNWAAIKEEYADLADDERSEIVSWVKLEFDIDNDYIEAKIEAALEAAAAFEKFFSIKKPAA